MMGLTEKQQACLDFIRSHKEKTGYMPRYDDMLVALRISSRGRIHQLLDGLVERGAIRRIKGRARAIELVEPTQAVILNRDVYSLLSVYAAGQHISVDTAAGELLRDALGASA